MRQFAVSSVAALLGLSVLWYVTDGFRALTAEAARRIEVQENPRPVPAVKLQTMTGGFETLPGDGPILLEFIYTTCPTICQTSGGDFAELRDHLASHGVRARMLSVSFDPKVDGLPELQNYAELHGASGTPWAIARPDARSLPDLLDFFRVTVIPDEWGGYQHNIAVLLINEQGEFAGVFDTRAFDEIRRAIEAS